MAGLGRWAGFVLGLVIVGATFSSVVGTIVLPKGVRSLISFTVWRGIKLPFLAAAGRMRRYESKDRLLGLLGPVSLLALLGAWLLLLLLTESHVNYPWLLSFRSPYPLRSLGVSLLAVLDAAALYLALVPSRAPSAARHCLRTGFLGLWALAGVYRIEMPADPRPDAPIALTYEEFEEGLDRLQAVGFPMERPREEAWRHFRGWRVNYETAAYLLADKLVAVPAPWSGERRSLRLRSDQLLEPVRPRHRSPDDPEGRTGLLPPRPEPSSRRSETSN